MFMTDGSMTRAGTIMVGCTILLAAAGTLAGQAPVITEAQKLLASDGAPSDKFGFAVAREGDTLIIGAPQHYTNALPGSFYVFERNGAGYWVEQARVFSDYQPGEAEFGDIFGDAVALQGDTLLVGAPFANLDGETLVGRVYFFARHPDGSWVRQQVLLPDGGMHTRFGEDVILVGDTAVITGLYRAFVFTRDASGVWSQQAELQGFDLDSIRGLAFDGQRIALTSGEFPTDHPQAVVFDAGEDGWGAPQPIMSSAPGFPVTAGAWFLGDQFALGIHDLDGPDYVFLFGPDESRAWTEQHVLTNPDTEDPYPHTHGFGSAIHGDGSAMIVGARFGNRAYVLHREPGGAWTYVAQLRPTDAYEFARNFGDEVHLRDHLPVVGSWAHHENGLYAGAVYVFDTLTPQVAGDVDGDGDVDLNDYAAFSQCMTGPDVPAGPACGSSDLDVDGDADLKDAALLSTHFGNRM